MEMAVNDWKWLELAGNGRNVWKWLEVAGNVWKWTKIMMMILEN